MLCWAMPWPMAGTLETMAVPRAPAPSFWACSCWATVELTPSWSKTAFFWMSEVTVLLAEAVSEVADCCRVRASVSDSAWAPWMEVVAVLMVVWASLDAVRTLEREVGSVAVTPWESD